MPERENLAASERWKHLREHVVRPAAPTARKMRHDYHLREVLATNGPHTVKYWDDDNRTAGELRIVAGQVQLPSDLIDLGHITDASCRLWFRDDLRVGYVLGRDTNKENTLYAFRHTPGWEHHSSPMAGRPVIDAGMMTILGGRIAYIEHKSGHYKPNPEQVFRTLNHLKAAGVDLNGVYYSERVPRPGYGSDEVSPGYLRRLVDSGAVTLYHAKALQETKEFESSRVEVPPEARLEDVTRLPPLRQEPNPPAGCRELTR